MCNTVQRGRLLRRPVALRLPARAEVLLKAPAFTLSSPLGRASERQGRVCAYIYDGHVTLVQMDCLSFALAVCHSRFLRSV